MSGKGRVGGYTWWPSDYLADEHVRAMTYEQEGVYRACLDLAWLHGSIPADLPALAKVLGKGLNLKRLERLWPGIAPCWQERDGRLVNGRMERERADMEAYREERSLSGRRGNAKRWQSDGKAMAQGSPPTPTPSPTPTPRELHAANAAAEPVGSWYGRVLKPLLYPKKGQSRDDENRDVQCLKTALKSFERSEVEAAVMGARAVVDRGGHWIGERGCDFTLRVLLTPPQDGGANWFERFRDESFREPKKRVERGGMTALADLLKGGT